jgi:predicted ATPase
MGTTLLTIGKLSEARQWLEQATRSSLHLDEHQLPVSRHSSDRAMARAMLARALWLQGFPDRAYSEARASIDDVRDPSHQRTMCRVLYYGIGRIAPMTGEFSAAESAVATLIELATRINDRFWLTAGQFLRGKLLVQRHSYAEGLAVLSEAFEICRQTGWRLSYPEFTGSHALALAGLGRLDEAFDAVSRAIESAGGRVDGQQWYVPELLRIKGEILLRKNEPGAIPLIEDSFNEAAQMAIEQGALFWELRVALGRARLRATQGRQKEAIQLLAPVYDRFKEGFGTTDMQSASELLRSLSASHPD